MFVDASIRLTKCGFSEEYNARWKLTASLLGLSEIQRALRELGPDLLRMDVFSLSNDVRFRDNFALY